MRASSYVIYVDLPNDQQEMLLVHGYTGAYDKVTRRVATYVRSLEVSRPPKPLYGEWSPEPPVEGVIEPPSSETLRVLRRRGYLTDMTVQQEEGFLKKITQKLHERQSKIPSYIFMPTYDCNLRCAYCFQDHMRTDPKFQHLLRTMSVAVIDRIFEGITRIETEIHGVGPETPIRRSIGFFGGEPLLAASRPVIEYIIEKAIGLGGASFWAVSNATELDAYEDLLSQERIASIQVTLDGPPAEHDKRRIYPDGSGSFAKIARNVTMALDRGIDISVRMNLDRNNVEQLPEVAEAIHAHKWDLYPGFSAYAAPIRATRVSIGRPTTMDSWELDQAIAEMEKQYSLLSIIDKPDDGIKDQTRRIFHDPENVIPSLNSSFCSAHTGMYIFDAFGDIYACWERTGDPSIRIGNINEDGSLNLNDATINLWRSRTVASNPVCSKCRYALHCGGGCAVLAQGKTGKLHMNYCDGFASRFRANVAEAYLEHVSGIAIKTKARAVCDQ
jgi:uncharacterized protein